MKLFFFWLLFALGKQRPFPRRQEEVEEEERWMENPHIQKGNPLGKFFFSWQRCCLRNCTSSSISSSSPCTTLKFLWRYRMMYPFRDAKQQSSYWPTASFLYITRQFRRVGRRPSSSDGRTGDQLVFVSYRQPEKGLLL